MHQVAVPVAVKIDGVVVIGFRLELKLTDLAMRRTAHLPRREIAAVDHPQREHQLFLELLGTAAVVAQGGERLDARQIAHHLAEIGLQPPIGDHHRARHAVLLLDPLEHGGVFVEHRLADLQAIIRHHAALERQKILGKNALAAIVGNGCRIIGDAIERGGDGPGRDALRDRLLLEALQPFAETGRARTIGGKCARR